MLFIRLIETIIIRVAAFLIQSMLAKDFEDFNEVFDEVFNKTIDSAKKIFL